MTVRGQMTVVEVRISTEDLEAVARMAAEETLASVAHLLREPSEYMSAEEVAEMVGGDLTVDAVYAWGTRGLLTAYRPTARVTRFKRSEVVALMEGGRRTPTKRHGTPTQCQEMSGK